MEGRRVAILYTHSLFGEGIARLLAGEEGFEVVPIDAAMADARDRLRGLGPDTVVVEGDPAHEDVLGLLLGTGTPLVIRVTLANNSIDLYRTLHVTVTRVEDLKRAIRNGNGSDATCTRRTVRRAGRATAGRRTEGGQLAGRE